MTKTAKTKIAIGILILAALAAAGYGYFRPEAIEAETVTAARKTIRREVAVTGKTKPADDVRLAFEVSGRVLRVPVRVGDRVAQGQVLAELERTELSAEFLEAEAILAAEQAELDELRRGTRPEEIAIQEAKTIEARTDLVSALRDAFTKADDAVRNRVDQFIANPRSQNPQLAFSTADSGLEIAIERGRVAIEARLDAWGPLIAGLNGAADLEPQRASAHEHLAAVRQFLEPVALAVNGLVASAAVSQTTVDGYKSAVATARANVDTVRSNLSAREADLLVAERELAEARAGATAEGIAAQEALVRQAEAKRAIIAAKIAKRTLSSPIAGLVTKREANPGEIVAANETVIAVVSTAEYEIEANVAEVDIADVRVGADARVTLDALPPGAVFAARVVAVDPAETVVEGVATYRTTLQFLETDGRIKPGMSANLEIQSDVRENAIAVPQRAVITRDGRKFARVLEGSEIREVEVETGLRGSDGSVEITRGIAEGAEVVVFIKE